MDSDQTGFVCERQTQDNIRWMMHVIDHVTKENIRAVVISLDAEKAYDCIWHWKDLVLKMSSLIVLNFCIHQQMLE